MVSTTLTNAPDSFGCLGVPFTILSFVRLNINTSASVTPVGSETLSVATNVFLSLGLAVLSVELCVALVYVWCRESCGSVTQIGLLAFEYFGNDDS